MQVLHGCVAHLPVVAVDPADQQLHVVAQLLVGAPTFSRLGLATWTSVVLCGDSLPSSRSSPYALMRCRMPLV